MAFSHEIAIWVDAEKYEAMSEHLALKGLTVEQVIDAKIEALYREVVPVDQRCEITKRAEAEQQRKEKEDAENRRYALYKVTRDDKTFCFEDEFYTNFFPLAWMVRQFERGDKDIGEVVFTADPGYKSEFRTNITLDQYNEQASLFTNIKQVIRVFDIDLDHGYFSVGDRQHGYATYRIKDVATAAYYAGKGKYRGADWREDEMFRRLEGKAVHMNPVRTLQL